MSAGKPFAPRILQAYFDRIIDGKEAIKLLEAALVQNAHTTTEFVLASVRKDIESIRKQS